MEEGEEERKTITPIVNTFLTIIIRKIITIKIGLIDNLTTMEDRMVIRDNSSTGTITTMGTIKTNIKTMETSSSIPSLLNKI